MSGEVQEVPTVSVVIGCNGATQALTSCLEALAPAGAGVEVVVCRAVPSAPDLTGRYPWARFVHLPGALVPALWSEGIRQTSGEIVALTISPMIPAQGWIGEIIAAHAHHDAVGGAIEPGPGLRLRDLAEYLCRYSREMLPFAPHACLDLPGDNASYKRRVLERVSSTYAAGFWEPDVHRELASQGATLWHSDRLVVSQGRSAGAAAFVRQRLAHGRAYGHQRGARFGARRNLAGVLGAPLVPPLMLARIWRELTARRRLRLQAAVALPWILVYNFAWAIGEARGHLESLIGIPYAEAGAGG